MHVKKNKDAVRIIVVVGPTASGKSDLAVSLAKKFNGEVVSADSRQIYRGLDIGTGKITKREMRGVPHHMLSAASPRTASYSAGEYARRGRTVIRDIARRSKVPIVAGGTGFYIDALLGSALLSTVSPNPALRAMLETRSTQALFLELKKRDPKRASAIDPHNKRRLIRAIEIAKSPLKSTKSDFVQKYEVLKIGILVPDETLKKKIRARIRARIKQGMIAEVRRLHAHGLSWKRMEEFGLEYRFISRYLRGILSKEEMAEQLERASIRYAKRQKLWFSYDKKTKWFRPSETEKIKKVVQAFLKSRD